MAKKKETKQENRLPRTPIVAVMGHVDHGKTSLLDAIRGTSVQADEAGGITQNTRAHLVDYNGQKVTFVDTPGHEAFYEMRSRGAKVTDIVLLVVAADDGVQPQTKESIKFATEEKVPIIVAINKVDLPGKKLEKLRQELSTNGVFVEEHGGDVMSVEVSAIKKQGLDELMDSIILLAEVSELKKDSVTRGIGTGYILESAADKHLGPVALTIVKSGKVSDNNYLVYEGGYTKIRNILDENQLKLNEAEQGTPIWIIGLNNVLNAGEIVQFVETEKEAKELTKKLEKGEETLIEKEEVAEGEEEDDLDLLSELFTAQEEEKEIKYLNLVVRTDTQGTLEAVKHELEKLNDEEVKVKILDAATGDVTEKDIATAKNARGIVIGFQVNIPSKVLAIAKKERVLVRDYAIIYELLDEIAEVMDGLSDPIEEETEVARAKVKLVFQLSNGQYVAGSEVIKGTVLRGYRAYIQRGEERLENCKITSLKHNKHDVKEMKKGQDCGILLEPNIEVKEGDEIVCYKVEKI